MNKARLCDCWDNHEIADVTEASCGCPCHRDERPAPLSCPFCGATDDDPNVRMIRELSPGGPFICENCGRNWNKEGDLGQPDRREERT